MFVQVRLQCPRPWPCCILAGRVLKIRNFQLIHMLERKTFLRAKPGLMLEVSQLRASQEWCAWCT